MINRKYTQICNGVNISYVKEEKFKTSMVSFSMFLPLDEKDASVNAILSAVLGRSCSKYPEFSLFNKHLEELYGADIYSSISKVGDSQMITLSLICINDNVSFDKSNVVSEATELLCEVIFSPCIEDGKFRENDINQAKRQVKENIKSQYNDKKTYARLRCEELMCKNEKFGINKYGNENDIDKATSEDVYDAWKKALKTSKIEIIVSGSVDYDSIYKMFYERFSNIERKNIFLCNTEVIDSVDKVNEVKDVIDVSQCKLVMGFRTRYYEPKYDVFPTRLMIALLGGTPNSKLFLHVREELSLCYYCYSRYDRVKGIMLIESGVEKSNLDKAKKEILKQLDSIKKGDFTDKEVEETKLYLIQQFNKVEDSLLDINGWYISQIFSDKPRTPFESSQAIKNVTRNQIIEAANNITPDTFYTLIGNGGAQ